MWPGQTIANNKMGVTQEQRDELLSRLFEHTVTNMLSKYSFTPTTQTMKRIANDHEDFKEALDRIEAMSFAAWETEGLSMMRSGLGSASMFAKLTMNKKAFMEPKDETAPIAQRIEIVGITNRKEADEFKEEQNEQK